jgi:hypothetical protein
MIPLAAVRYGISWHTRRHRAQGQGTASVSMGLRLVLHLQGELSALAGERLFNRLRQLARLVGREPELAVG